MDEPNRTGGSDYTDGESHQHRIFNAAGSMIEVREVTHGGWMITMNAASGDRRVISVDGTLEDATAAAMEAARPTTA